MGGGISIGCSADPPEAVPAISERGPVPELTVPVVVMLPVLLRKKVPTADDGSRIIDPVLFTNTLSPALRARLLALVVIGKNNVPVLRSWYS